MTPSELIYDAQLALDDDWWIEMRGYPEEEKHIVTFTKLGQPAIVGKARTLKAALAKALEQWADL